MQEGAFFDAVREPLFGGSLSSSQVCGTIAIVDRGLAVRTPLRHLSYMLATTFRETAKTMQPILETRNAKDKANPSIETAIRRLDAAFAAGKLPLGEQALLAQGCFRKKLAGGAASSS